MEKALLVKVMANADSFKKGMNQANSHLLSFRKSIDQFKGAMIAAFSVAAVTSFVKSSVQGYLEEEQAIAKLTQAMGGRIDATERLRRQASDLQRVTTFGDDETIQAQAALAMMIGDNEAAIKKLTPAVQDLATGLNMDLVSAAQLVGKTLASSTNALSRYGLQVEGAVGSGERLDSVLKSLNEKFAGQALAAGSTISGELTQLKNAWGDIKEEIGKAMLALVVPVYENVKRNKQASREIYDNYIAEQERYNNWLKSNGVNVTGLPEYDWSRLTGGNNPNNTKSNTEEVITLEKLNTKLKELKDQRNTTNIDALSGIDKEIFKIEELIKKYTKLTDVIIDNSEQIKIHSKYFTDKYQKIVDDVFKVPQKSKADPFANVSFDLEEEFFPDEDKMDQALVEWRKNIERFSADINNLIKDTLSDGIVSIADILGEAIVTGDLEGMFNNILKSVASFLQQMGVMFVAYGISMIAFKKAFINPVALVLAGGALVALGGGIKALANKGISGHDSGQNDLQLTSSIKGSDLQLILSRTGAQQGRF